MTGSCPIGGWRVVSPPVVDGHYIEGESPSIDLADSTLPPLIFGGVEVEPVRMPTKFRIVWEYGHLFTVALQRHEERGVLHVRFQSSSFALWTSHTQYIDAVMQLAQALHVPVAALKTTRIDVAVDVEGLDVTHELIDFITGHRGGLGGGVAFKPGMNGGRQIEIGSRASSKRFIRIYLKTAMDCTTYLPTWLRQGYSGGRVVRVEVEFKNGGLPSRSPFYYDDAGRAADLYSDAVARYRVVKTPENSKTAPKSAKAGRASRAVTHPAWAALTEAAAKWMEPPEPKWTTRQRLDAARSRLSRALGSVAARLEHRWGAMEDVDDTLDALRAMGRGEQIVDDEQGWRIVGGPPRVDGLSDEDFAKAREQTRKREALLADLAKRRAAVPTGVAIDWREPSRAPYPYATPTTPTPTTPPGPAMVWTCCGRESTGERFCPACGPPLHIEPATWPCCGRQAFRGEVECPRCGAPEKPPDTG